MDLRSNIGRVLFVGWLGLAGFIWVGPVLADRYWWDSLPVSIASSLVMLLIGVAIFFFRTQALAGTWNVLQLLFQVLGNQKARRILILITLCLVVVANWQEVPWAIEETEHSLKRIFWGIEDWVVPILWREPEGLTKIIIILAVLVPLIWLVRRLGGPGQVWPTVKGGFYLSLFAFVNKWWEMQLTYRIGTAFLVLFGIIRLYSGRTIDAMIVFFALFIVIYRGWPRVNPFHPPPIDPFDLPVVRLFGRPDKILVSIASFCILLPGVFLIFVTWQIFPFVISLILNQVFFVWYVSKRPLVLTNWLKVTVNPQTRQMIIRRHPPSELTGGISRATLDMNVLRVKETSGIWDNFARILGIFLVEIEPVGVKRERGEVETFEFYVQAAHWMYDERGVGPVRGPAAFIAWAASLSS